MLHMALDACAGMQAVCAVGSASGQNKTQTALDASAGRRAGMLWVLSRQMPNMKGSNI